MNHLKPTRRPRRAFKPWYVPKGAHIDNFTVCTAIGRGSGAVVYEVKDSAGMLFALKLSLRPVAVGEKNPVSVDRLLTSIMAHLAVIELPTVPRLIGHGFLRKPEGAFPYLVMELVPEAETITDWAAHTAPTFAKVAKVFNELATALGALADKRC